VKGITQSTQTSYPPLSHMIVFTSKNVSLWSTGHKTNRTKTSTNKTRVSGSVQPDTRSVNV